MTTIHSPSTTTTPSWPMFAAVSAGVAAVLTAVGTFWSPLSSYTYEARFPEDLYSYAIVLAIIAAGVALVFGLVVRSAPAAADRRAIVLAVLGVLTVAVFWTGLPLVLVAGAVSLVVSRPVRPATRIGVQVAAVLVTAAAIWLALAG